MMLSGKRSGFVDLEQNVRGDGEARCERYEAIDARAHAGAQHRVELAARDARAFGETAEPWNEIKHIEQVVMRLDATALSDGRPLVYDDELGLEPAILVRKRPSGDVLCVWNRTTLAGVERPPGVLMPAVPRARFDDLGEWIERIGGPPHPTALLANPVRTAPDTAVVAGWGTALGERLVAKRALPRDLLEHYLHRLATRSFRPRSIVARAASPGTVYLVVAEATALPWRWVRDLDRGRLSTILQGAASRRETAICVFSEGLTRKTYGCILETSPSRRPLASVVEFSLEEAELEWTLRNYACAGYRLLALFDEPDGLTDAGVARSNATLASRRRWRAPMDRRDRSGESGFVAGRMTRPMTALVRRCHGGASRAALCAVFSWVTLITVACQPPEQSCDVDLRFDLLDGPLCFAEPIVIDGAGHFATLGDLDADGDVDLVEVRGEGIYVRWNDDGALPMAILITGTEFSDAVLPVQLDDEPGLELVAWGEDRLAIIDFDDGRVPTLAQSYSTIVIPEDLPASDPDWHFGSRIGAGDFDGDGDADLLTSWGELIMWQNEGGLAFGEMTLGAGAGTVTELSAVLVADINGDGLDDAAVNTFDADGGLQIVLARADALPEPILTNLPAFATFGRAVDMDQDGIEDAVGSRAYLRGRADEQWGPDDLVEPRPRLGCEAVLHVPGRSYCVRFEYPLIDHAYCGVVRVHVPEVGTTDPPKFASTTLVHPEMPLYEWLPYGDDARVSDKEYFDTPGTFADFDGDGREDLIMRAESISDDLTVFLARNSCD